MTGVGKLAKNGLKRARAWTRTIEAANDGDLDALQKILIYVHGREGPRKRALLADLLRKDEDAIPKDASALEDVISKMVDSDKVNHGIHDLKPGNKIYELLKSEQANPPMLHGGGKRIRSVQPQIPRENSWSRSIPVKRSQNMMKKWWAGTLDKIFPPVPCAEWERLKGLSRGTIPLEEPPHRRAAPQKEGKETWSKKTEDIVNWLEARPKISDADKHIAEVKDGVLEVDTAANEDWSKMRRHKARVRSIRRTYAVVWNMTPRMFKAQGSNEWTIQWGEQKSEAKSGNFSLPNEAEYEFFEGLEDIELPTAKVKTKMKGGNRFR